MSLATPPPTAEKSVADRPATSTQVDPRLHAFCQHKAAIFGSVAAPTQIFTPDPMDVPSIHEPAREAFFDVYARADTAARQERSDRRANDPLASVGQVQLILGDSGAGKTHLLRSMRSTLHGSELGYFAYMQMSSQTNDYATYAMRNIVDSLDHPHYYGDTNLDKTTSLKRLSNQIAECDAVLAADLDRLRQPNLAVGVAGQIAGDIADQVVTHSRFAGINVDLMAALLLLQSDGNAVAARVKKYLRCEALSDRDRRHLGGMQPVTDGTAEDMIVQIGKLIAAVGGGAMVVCLDQLEVIFDLQSDQRKATEQFKNIVASLNRMAGHVPNFVGVIAALEDFYVVAQQELTKSDHDRLVSEPPTPIKLNSKLTRPSVDQLVANHLRLLLTDAGYDDSIVGQGRPATYPVPESLLERCVGNSTRAALLMLRQYRDRCIAAGRLVDAESDGEPPVAPEVIKDDVTLDQWDQTWTDFHGEFTTDVPDEDDELADVLQRAVETISGELPSSLSLLAEREDDQVQLFLSADEGSGVRTDGRTVARWRALVCNRSARGGSLGKRLKSHLRSVSQSPDDAVPLLVRTEDYRPTTTSSAIARLLAEMVQRGGRKAIVPDADWRFLMAMQSFDGHHRGNAGYAAWRADRRPVASLQSIGELLRWKEVVLPAASGASSRSIDERPIDDEPTDNAVSPVTEPIAPVQSPVQTSASDPTDLILGRTRSREPSPVTLGRDVLMRHTAVLGSSGSGKTTAVLNIVEQLIVGGVPVMLIDRKGDLSAYADPDAYHDVPDDPELAQRHRRLRQRGEFVVYTPGNLDGHPVKLPVAPAGMRSATETERRTMAKQSAESIGSVLGYTTASKQNRVAVVLEAIDLIGSRTDKAVDLAMLIDELEEMDDALVTRLGSLAGSLPSKIVPDLTTLQITNRTLMSSVGTAMDGETFVTATDPSKTRMSILNLSSLIGDATTEDFWVSQFLTEIGRWMNQSPTRQLRAALVFDETDRYLPATGKPSTKPPMENLLRRARSAGLGLILATQNPGDFDYRCRDNIETWMIGKISDDRAIDKVANRCANFAGDLSAELSGQTVGQFLLSTGNQTRRIQSERSVVQTRQLSPSRIIELAKTAKP